MRKLFAVLLFTIALVGIGNAQNSMNIGSTFVVYDSLWNDIYVPDTVFAISGTDTLGSMIDTSEAQTVVIIPLGGEYDWLTLTAIDTGTTYDDSIMVEYSNYKVALTSGKMAVIDTVWQPVQFIRDSSWTNISGALLVDDNSTKSFQIFVGDYESIRVRMINATAVENRVWRFIAQANRKK